MHDRGRLPVRLWTLTARPITPLIQQRAVALPPGLILGTQVIVGGLLGALGLALATPLLATAVVLVDMLYIKDVPGDESLA